MLNLAQNLANSQIKNKFHKIVWEKPMKQKEKIKPRKYFFEQNFKVKKFEIEQVCASKQYSNKKTKPKLDDK